MRCIRQILSPGSLVAGLVALALMGCGATPTSTPLPARVIAMPTQAAAPVAAPTATIQPATPTRTLTPTSVATATPSPSATEQRTATPSPAPPTPSPSIPLSPTVTISPLTPTRGAASVPTVASASGASACPQGCPEEKPGCDIKGNISDKKEKIYHMKGWPSYAATKIDPSKGERWFCTPEEATANGWRAAQH